jgi:lipopolysaccharide transport system ATP-binding protein
MSGFAIRAESLSKLYRLGPRERYKALRDTLTHAMYAPVRRLSQIIKHKRGSDDPSGSTAMAGASHIWALKDASFEVKQGEVIGIIGRNGAGKTTLLKILSRVTEPTEGCAEMWGRIGSLLEVGTGFHPELTGRENIFLNGAILGMKKTEIKRKFDEIVAFAEVEKFLDTPVKHYSGGMFVRLAFSVAAHLEPEILLVDEVLAVGDLAFQKKCLGKMGDVAKGGRTILLVSHQMNQIRRLCERAIWLDGGKIRKIGATADIVSSYEAAMSSISFESVRGDDDGHIAARFLKWEIVEPQNEQLNILSTMGPATLRFLLKVNSTIRNGHHGIALFDGSGQLMWGADVNKLVFNSGIYELAYKLPSLPLRPGAYFWRVSLYDEKGLVDAWDCIPELIVATKPVTHSRDEWAGLLNIPYEFTVRTSR